MANQSSMFDKNIGYTCPCCSLFVKRYRRGMNCNMALALICLYRHSENKFVHLEKFLSSHGYQRCGDASYLTAYGLLEKKIALREDDSPRNGFYKLTSRGVLFAENRLTVPEKFLWFNGKCEGFEGKEINIHDALGKKFSYEKLMSNT